MLRHVVTLATLFALCLPGGVAQAAPRHLRVIWGEDPAHHAIISWSTNARGQVHEVYYDTTPRSGVLSAYVFQNRSPLSGSYNGGRLNYHHAELSGLSPSTTYYFVVVSDGKASPERHFVTGPEDDRPFKLLYGGDSRSNRSSRKGMNRKVSQLLTENPTILALWHGGDFISRGNNLGKWSAWLDDHKLTTTKAGRVLPIIPTRGNHEGNGVLYNTVMAWPGGKQVDYFTTRIGLNSVLITLDSNSPQGGTQAQWLDQALKKAQGSRWILASYHRPAYPAVKSPGGALQHWVPLFEQYNVDLVCESDGHALKRTVPIRNGMQDPTGIVYVGEGGLGVRQRSPHTNRWYLRGSGMARSGHHVQVLSFTPKDLTYQAILMDGSVADTYVAMPRRTGVLPPSPPNPTPPPGSIPPPPPGSVPPPPPGSVPSPPVGPGTPPPLTAPGVVGPSIGGGCRSVGGASTSTVLLLFLGGWGLVASHRKRMHRPQNTMARR